MITVYSICVSLYLNSILWHDKLWAGVLPTGLSELQSMDDAAIVNWIISKTCFSPIWMSARKWTVVLGPALLVLAFYINIFLSLSLSDWLSMRQKAIFCFLFSLSNLSLLVLIKVLALYICVALKHHICIQFKFCFLKFISFSS